MAIGFLFVGIWSFIFSDSILLGVVFLSVSLCFLAITYLKEGMLAPLNMLWMKFGVLLGTIVNPIILAILFFGLFTPLAIILRVFGRDELKIKKSRARSYWTNYDSSVRAEDYFRNQF